MMGGNGRGSEFCSSKKKQKQPRRGAGIAELERLRMLPQQQMAPVNPPTLQPPSFNGVLSLQNKQKDPKSLQMPYSSFSSYSSTSTPYSTSYAFQRNISSSLQNLQQVPEVKMTYSPIPSASTPYSALYGFQPNITMGLSEYEKTNISYGDSHPNNTARREHTTAILENQSSASAQSSIIRPFLNLHDSQGINSEKYWSGSADSSMWNTQDVDLELRLSHGPATRKCSDSQPNNTARWEHTTAILENQSSAQSSIIRPFLNLQDSQGINSEKYWSGSADSSRWNTQDIDLELRLSHGPATRKCSDSHKK